MTIATERLRTFLIRGESKNVEFKEAKNNFENMYDYIAAMANVGGGHILLGVKNDGTVIGTNTFSGNLHKLPYSIYQKIGVTVDVDEVLMPEGRVLVFAVSKRPVGKVIKTIKKSKYKHPIRRGDSLQEMDDDQHKAILLEQIEDFTNKILPGTSIQQLNPKAIDLYKELYLQKNPKSLVSKETHRALLKSLGLIDRISSAISLAALLLFGKAEAIHHYVPQAEIIFEWRQQDNQIHHDFRKNWRDSVFLIFDDIWKTINSRNIRIPYQEGFIQKEIFGFDEDSVREAILNAIIHRDYSVAHQSIFIRANPKCIVIESPGGFVPPVTIENILTESAWRNRLFAETIEKTPLIERSGQGVDKIYKNTIESGKGIPNYSDSTPSRVVLSIPAIVQDREFIRFLSQIINARQINLSMQELYELELIRSGIKQQNLQSKDKFIEHGIIEKVGKGKGSKYILSHNYYKYVNKPGSYTRLRGITREEKKLLILHHIKKNGKGYKSEFYDVFPDLKQRDISNLLNELSSEGKIEFFGPKRTGYWTVQK